MAQNFDVDRKSLIVAFGSKIFLRGLKAGVSSVVGLVLRRMRSLWQSRGLLLFPVVSIF